MLWVVKKEQMARRAESEEGAEASAMKYRLGTLVRDVVLVEFMSVGLLMVGGADDGVGLLRFGWVGRDGAGELGRLGIPVVGLSWVVCLSRVVGHGGAVGHRVFFGSHAHPRLLALWRWDAYPYNFANALRGDFVS